jgi:integrase
MKNGERIALTQIDKNGETWDWLACSYDSPQEESVRFGMVFDKSKMRFLKVDACGNWIACDQKLAVSVFAGLRPSEAEALRWEHVKLDRGFLEVVRAKTRDRRNVALSANLVAWLKPLERDSGAVFEGHSRRWRDRVQKAIAKPVTADIEAGPLAKWPQDVLRHTYGSYHLEKHHNAPETAHQMGHQGNPRMLFNHYRDLVAPEDATAFWEIMP